MWMKFLHAWVKVNQSHAHAHHADDRQLQFIARLSHHRNAIVRVFIERILKNIHAVKAKFLGLVQPIHETDAVLFPSRVYHS
jgi:hypothetical protein